MLFNGEMLKIWYLYIAEQKENYNTQVYDNLLKIHKFDGYFKFFITI
jgi:hypothetical protein